MTKAQEDHFKKVAPKYMQRLLGDFPQLSPLDVCAIFGNAGHESKGLTDDQEDKPTVPGSRGGLNWFQWTGPRRKALEKFAVALKLQPDSDEAAYRFLVQELRGSEKAAIPAVLRARTLDTKTEAFEKAFERAGVKHYPERKAWALLALKAYEGEFGPIAPPDVQPIPPAQPLPPTLPLPPSIEIEVKEPSFFEKLFTNNLIKIAGPTLVRYAVTFVLGGIGTFLMSKGLLDAQTWAWLNAVLDRALNDGAMILIGGGGIAAAVAAALAGVKEAGRDKVVLNGTRVVVPQEKKEEIREAVNATLTK